MSWTAWLAIEAGSGVLLVLLAILSQCLPQRSRTRPALLWLLTLWGLQVASSASAQAWGGPKDWPKDWWDFSQVLLPCIALAFVLFAGPPQTEDELNLLRWGVVVSGVITAVLVPLELSDVWIVQGPPGQQVLVPGPWHALVVDAPFWWGTACALLLLTWPAPKPDRSWMVSGGLLLSWAFTAGFALRHVILNDLDGRVARVLPWAFLAVAIVIPVRLLVLASRSSTYHDRGVLIVALLTVTSGMGALFGLFPAWLTPGVVRIAATLVFLAPAILRPATAAPLAHPQGEAA